MPGHCVSARVGQARFPIRTSPACGSPLFGNPGRPSGHGVPGVLQGIGARFRTLPGPHRAGDELPSGGEGPTGRWRSNSSSAARHARPSTSTTTATPCTTASRPQHTEADMDQAVSIIEDALPGNLTISQEENDAHACGAIPGEADRAVVSSSRTRRLKRSIGPARSSRRRSAGGNSSTRGGPADTITGPPRSCCGAPAVWRASP